MSTAMSENSANSATTAYRAEMVAWAELAVALRARRQSRAPATEDRSTGGRVSRVASGPVRRSHHLSELRFQARVRRNEGRDQHAARDEISESLVQDGRIPAFDLELSVT